MVPQRHIHWFWWMSASPPEPDNICVCSQSGWSGRFVWPSTTPRDCAERPVTITPAQFDYLLEGIDWRLAVHVRSSMGSAGQPA